MNQIFFYTKAFTSMLVTLVMQSPLVSPISHFITGTPHSSYLESEGAAAPKPSLEFCPGEYSWIHRSRVRHQASGLEKEMGYSQSLLLLSSHRHEDSGDYYQQGIGIRGSFLHIHHFGLKSQENYNFIFRHSHSVSDELLPFELACDSYLELPLRAPVNCSYGEIDLYGRYSTSSDELWKLGIHAELGRHQHKSGILPAVGLMKRLNDQWCLDLFFPRHARIQWTPDPSYSLYGFLRRIKDQQMIAHDSKNVWEYRALAAGIGSSYHWDSRLHLSAELGSALAPRIDYDLSERQESYDMNSSVYLKVQLYLTF